MLSYSHASEIVVSNVTGSLTPCLKSSCCWKRSLMRWKELWALCITMRNKSVISISCSTHLFIFSVIIWVIPENSVSFCCGQCCEHKLMRTLPCNYPRASICVRLKQRCTLLVGWAVNDSCCTCSLFQCCSFQIKAAETMSRRPSPLLDPRQCRGHRFLRLHLFK